MYWFFKYLLATSSLLPSIELSCEIFLKAVTHMKNHFWILKGFLQLGFFKSRKKV